MVDLVVEKKFFLQQKKNATTYDGCGSQEYVGTLI